MNKKQKKNLIRIIITSVLIAIYAISERLIEYNNIYLKLVLFLIPYFLIGYDIIRKAVRGIVNGQAFDENLLMTIATIGAFVISIVDKSADFYEAVAVMLFYQIGEFFQSYAVGKSRKNISALMDIRPDYANIEKDGQIVKVSPDEVAVGSIIFVRPGEKIPIDGIIRVGHSSLNTTALTGESLPRDVDAGDEVKSGCINISGLLEIETTKEFGESTASMILNLVENSGMNKSKSENFISKFSRIYTPAVCIGALALAAVPPLIRLLLGMSAQWYIWVYRALTFLVISCPCALVISIPLSFFAGIGGASRDGILIKGSNYMETLSKLDTIVFDKTGTLTKGVFEVSGIHHNEIEDEKIIELAALAESSSTHPISRSIIAYYGKSIDRSRVKNIEEISGNGVIATVDGHEVAVGNDKLMQMLQIEYHDCHMVGTLVHVSVDRKYQGHILISDVIKPSSAAAIEQLKRLGISNIVMLTGDGEKITSKVANDLGIITYFSHLLPADKVQKVEELLEKMQRDKKLAFVGDGINDAPVLSRADIGMAMGAMGSDAAIEAADVVLMDDDPKKIVKAIKRSKKCMRIVYQNIVFALIIKALCLIMGAIGLANMYWAVFADVGVMIIAVLNAIRALSESGRKDS